LIFVADVRGVKRFKSGAQARCLIEQIAEGDPALLRMVLPLGKGKTYWFVKLPWSSAESGKCAQGAKALRNAENVFTIAWFRLL
jgi:hypothetical protein